MSKDLFGSEVFDRDVRRAGMGSHHSAASQTDEWLTPPELVNALGPFDLDPCSPGDRRPWDTAARHYSIEDDGLRQPWSGRVWLNPPYSDASHWLRRMSEHNNGTALIFARTETAAWFDYVWPYATALLFIRGRMNFHFVDGRRSGYNSGAPSVLIAYGESDAAVLASEPVPGRYVRLAPTP